MLLYQHSHGRETYRHNTKPLASTSEIRTGSSFGAGAGYVTVELGELRGDRKMRRTASLQITEDEARILITKLEGQLNRIEQWRNEESKKKSPVPNLIG